MLQAWEKLREEKQKHKQKKNNFNMQPQQNVGFGKVENKAGFHNRAMLSHLSFPLCKNFQCLIGLVVWKKIPKTGLNFFVLIFLKGLFQEANIIYRSSANLKTVVQRIEVNLFFKQQFFISVVQYKLIEII